MRILFLLIEDIDLGIACEVSRRLEPEMLVCERRNATSSRSAGEEAYLHKIRLVNVLKCDSLLANRCGKSLKSDGATVIELDNRSGLPHYR